MEQSTPQWLTPILTVIGSLGGIAGIWAIVWTIINIKSKKKSETAAACKAQGEADGIDLANFEKSLQILGTRVVNLETELTTAYNKIGELRQDVTNAKNMLWEQQITIVEQAKALEYSDRLKCEKMNCLNRMPPLKKLLAKNRNENNAS